MCRSYTPARVPPFLERKYYASIITRIAQTSPKQSGSSVDALQIAALRCLVHAKIWFKSSFDLWTIRARKYEYAHDRVGTVSRRLSFSYFFMEMRSKGNWKIEREYAIKSNGSICIRNAIRSDGGHPRTFPNYVRMTMNKKRKLQICYQMLRSENILIWVCKYGLMWRHAKISRRRVYPRFPPNPINQYFGYQVDFLRDRFSFGGLLFKVVF